MPDPAYGTPPMPAPIVSTETRSSGASAAGAPVAGYVCVAPEGTTPYCSGPLVTLRKAVETSHLTPALGDLTCKKEIPYGLGVHEIALPVTATVNFTSRNSAVSSVNSTGAVGHAPNARAPPATRFTPGSISRWAPARSARLPIVTEVRLKAPFASMRERPLQT